MENDDGTAGGGAGAVLGVRFHEAGKIYYFEPGGYTDLEAGGYVVVETSRGVELGRIVIAPGQVLSSELTEPLKSILRPGTPADLDQSDRLKQGAAEATALARERARALDLPMKVVSAQYTLDGTRLTIFFTSEGRVDFRDLVRDLGHQIHAQVQLRQVGPRDQAKLIGGYGRCGRRLCCSSWLTAFPGISIKMAKEQNLPLNPSKISGQCGRLLCCLSYENDVYKQLKAALPRPDSWVSTPGGNARVVAVNAIKQLITLQMEDFRMVEMTVAQLGLETGVVRVLPAGAAAASAEPGEGAWPEGDEARGEPRRPGRDVLAPGLDRTGIGWIAASQTLQNGEVVEEVVSLGVFVQETIVRRNTPPAGGSARPPDARNGRGAPNGPRQSRGDNPARATPPPPRASQPAVPAPIAGSDPAAPADGVEQKRRRRRRHRGGGTSP